MVVERMQKKVMHVRLFYKLRSSPAGEDFVVYAFKSTSIIDIVVRFIFLLTLFFFLNKNILDKNIEGEIARKIRTI